jgi:CheY-like chemotaxis protein
VRRAKGAPNVRVLVVESDKGVSSLLMAVLADEGHETVVVLHRRAALGVVDGRRFDACVCDGFDASSTAETPADRAELSALQAAVPVVLCTAHTWAVSLGAQELGVSAVLAKPFQIDDLLTVLQAARRAD